MGGLEAHTHALASELHRRGHQVCLFAAPGSDPGLMATELPVGEFVSSDAARADVGCSPDGWMQEHHAYLGLMLSLARGEHGEFDVVHNNSLHHLPVAMSELLDFPVLTTLHTPPVAWLESAICFAATRSRFIAVSQHVAAQWAHSVSTQVVLNGVDTTAWRPGPGGERAVRCGRLVSEKAPHEAIDAAHRAGIGIDLVGPIHDAKYFATQIRPRLGPAASYLGHLGVEELRTVVGGSRVAVVTPRWAEPFGLVAAEALACGTPVAAYDAGALSEIVDAQSGRLAPIGDLDGLAIAMGQAARLDRAAARRRACEHFDQRRMVDDYEQIYRGLSALGDVA